MTEIRTLTTIEEIQNLMDEDATVYIVAEEDNPENPSLVPDEYVIAGYRELEDTILVSLKYRKGKFIEEVDITDIFLTEAECNQAIREGWY